MSARSRRIETMKRLPRLAQVAALLTLATTLAACGHNRAVSVTGGEARAIEPPPVEIRGATSFDQRWIDATIESGVQGLGWPRPAPRPPELDAKPVAQPAAKPVVKKKRFLDRFRRNVS